MSELHDKKHRLEDYLRQLDNVAIAFSAGVDSTFLLKTAHDILGDNAVAVTARSNLFPQKEFEETVEFCKKENIEQIIFDYDELSVGGFSDNPPDRCYICKLELFTKILEIAAERGLDYVAEGTNIDDEGDYRPGLKALKELNIKSPLREAGLTKDDIRALSEKMGLPTWDKPSYACLATRLVYGDAITSGRLAMVEKAEQKLHDLGFNHVRVRVHKNVARIETDRSRFAEIIKPEIADEINSYFRSLGFLYVSLDLAGYKTGSMNRELTENGDTEEKMTTICCGMG